MRADAECDECIQQKMTLGLKSEEDAKFVCKMQGAC